MRTYGQFCPIAIGAEIFAERWTPLIIRELMAGSSRFNDMQRGLPRIPRAMLSQRLRYLQACGVAVRTANGEYRLTEAGESLAMVAIDLGTWARRWGYAGIREDNLDPDFLLWDMHRGIHLERLPDGRVTVQIDLTGSCVRSYWLVLERPEPSMCLTDPGFEVDLLVTADTLTLHRIWVAEEEWASALRSGRVSIEGDPALRSAFPTWLTLGYFANR